MSFVHLHVHTQYSILDGAARIKSLYSKKDKKKRLMTGLIDKAKEYNMPGIAITDHGNMFGVMEFYSEAKSKGIIPVIGCELYLAPKGRFYKKQDNSEEKSAMHILFLAKNKEGYNNLMKLVSLGYTEGFYYRPRIDYELIEKYHKGLICLSGCMGAHIPISIRKGDINGAQKLIEYHKSIFGRDFYIELQDHNMPEERPLNTNLYKLAKKNDVEIVITNDVHYVNKEDAYSHEVLLAVQTKSTMDNPKRYRFQANEFHLKSVDEMKKSFSKLTKAFENTINIAEECKELDILNKNYFMPEYEVSDNETKSSALKKLCMEGLNKYYNNNIPKEALERLEMELSVISNMGYEGYFLIVQDFINYAKKNNISVGPGRGSAAGSIVAFSTGITMVNPLDYNLLFERFLNPERKSMPDIDIDFQDDKRDDVIEYVKNKYGRENVSQITTFNTLNGRSAIRDVCRAMNISLDTADRIAKLIPNSGTLIDVYNEDKIFKKEIDSNSELTKMFDIASKLEGLVRSVGLHAAGIVVSSKPLIECTPLYQDTKTGIIASQYEMNFIENAGLIKIDFLGIKNLRLLQDAIKDIYEKHGKEIDIENIPLNDDKVYEIFRNADTGGIFQFESDGMRKMLMDIKPTVFDDLVSSVALYRPGPLNSGMGKQYADTKNKKISLKYMHPDLEPILKETQGVLIYQEQIMAISRVIGGFTPAQADDLRKAMGKKQIETMEKMKEKFINGGVERGYNKKLLVDLYEMMRGFAEYGFNKSHSVCYALIAYQEAYIKAHYILEYYVALLNTTIGDTDKISLYLDEIRQHKIEVIMPNVLESSALFSQKDSKIIYALHAIKGIGHQAALAIEEERNKNGKFKSLEDFAHRVNIQLVNKKVYESLIKSSAFEEFGHTMSSLMASIDSIVSYAYSYQKEASSGQYMLFDSSDENLAIALLIQNMLEYDNNALRENEIETLGFSFKHHPFKKYVGLIDYKYYNNTLDLKDDTTINNFILPCVLTSKRRTTSKSNIPILVMNVLDFYSDITFFIKTDKEIEKFDGLCEINNSLLIKGKKEKSKYDGKIYMTVKDITNLDKSLQDKNKKLNLINRETKVDKTNKNQETQKEANNTNIHIENKNLTNGSYVELSVNKKSFDEIDLHYLHSTIKNFPGKYPIKLCILDENGKHKRFEIDDIFRVNANNDFFEATKENIRSLVCINLVS